MQTEANIEQQQQSAYVQSMPELQSNEDQVKNDQTSARPEYFPKELWDDIKGQPKIEEVYKKLSESEKRIEGFRKVLSDKKSFEEYKAKEGQPIVEQVEEAYQLSEEVPLDVIPLKEQDLEQIWSSAKASGINNKQINTFLKSMMEIEKAEAEVFKKETYEKLGPDADKLIKNIDSFIMARLNAKTFSEEEGKAIADVINNGGADGIRAFAKIIELTGEKAIPISVRAHSEHNTFEDAKYALMEALKQSGGKETQEVRQAREKLERFN